VDPEISKRAMGKGERTDLKRYSMKRSMLKSRLVNEVAGIQPHFSGFG